MDNLKVEVMKKVLLIDTEEELKKIKEFASDCIMREYDKDDEDRKAFKKWKEQNGSKEDK